ncbi:DUF1801 domain-containing protein [Aliishimia ponticola]|uniref:DUF1801 domain-containing protein n=1 Tax=Aliishimia ponticola TaxID=2499833 RepID=A0A4S4NAI9_9RHOB|nr:DUF1801 domain-containing protein [Aliishimia ponticola]
MDAAPARAQAGLWALRGLILDTARTLPEIGPVTECLKWGQPSFTTPVTKSGSTLRIGCPKAGGFALFAHCQTTIISDFVSAFPGLDRVDGNRAILFDDPAQIEPARHGQLVAHALRYHL